MKSGGSHSSEKRVAVVRVGIVVSGCVGSCEAYSISKAESVVSDDVGSHDDDGGGQSLPVGGLGAVVIVSAVSLTSDDDEVKCRSVSGEWAGCSGVSCHGVSLIGEEIVERLAGGIVIRDE